MTRSEILATFRKGYRYFNTFGGNPVSCAAAMAVLEEIEDKNLIENAKTVGPARQRAHGTAAGKIRGYRRRARFGSDFWCRDGAGSAQQGTRKRIHRPGDQRDATPGYHSFKARAAQEHSENSSANAILDRKRRPSVRYFGRSFGPNPVGLMTAIVEQALALWGMEGADWSLVAARENHVYRVACLGHSCALRLHRQGLHSDAALQSELEWIAELGARGVWCTKACGRT